MNEEGETKPCGKCGSCIDAQELRARSRELAQAADYYEATCVQKAPSRAANAAAGAVARVVRRAKLKKATPAGMVSADEAADRPSDF